MGSVFDIDPFSHDCPMRFLGHLLISERYVVQKYR